MSRNRSYRPVVLASLMASVAILSLGWAKVLQTNAVEDRSTWPVVEEYKVLPPPKAAPFIYAWLGRQLGADITWTRALVYYGSSTVGESDFRYLEKFLDNIIELDPKFRRAYEWAANAVAWKNERATVDEFKTSVRYLEKAITAFPDDWRLHQTLALRYAYDLAPASEEERRRNMIRAAELLEHAARMPGARIQLATMAANLRSLLGQRNRALAEMRLMIMSTDNPAAQAKLMRRYRSMLKDDAVDDEIMVSRKRFNLRWHANLPFARADWFVLLGERPTPRVDLEAISPTRDLLTVAVSRPPEDVEPPDATAN